MVQEASFTASCHMKLKLWLNRSDLVSMACLVSHILWCSVCWCYHSGLRGWSWTFPCVWGEWGEIVGFSTGSNVRSIPYQYPCGIFILYDAYVHLLRFDWCVLRNTINHIFTYGQVLSTWKATYHLSEFLSVALLHPVFRMSALKAHLLNWI